MASSPPPFTNSLKSLIIIPNRHEVEDVEEEEEEESPYSTPIFRLTPRRTPSFSSESSSESLFSSSNDNSYPPYSPSTPLKSKLGIPFSWERIPGLPKHQESKNKKECPEHLLPPPPARNSLSGSSGKKSHHHPTNDVTISLQRDPFFAALVECSKDDHHQYHNNNNHGPNLGNMVCSKITRAFSDRFGLMNLYAAVSSCKRTCSVSESIACLPRSSSPHYLMHNRR